MRLAVALVAAAFVLAPSLVAHADTPCTPAPQATWGGGANATPAGLALPRPVLDTPAARARDLLARARILDELATSDEKAAAEIAARLPVLRTSAKSAREKADRATADEREAAVARAEDLETDLAVSEAESVAKKHAAIENRQTASALRARAVRIVREESSDAAASTPCDPPYRFTADGRKIYRIECFR